MTASHSRSIRRLTLALVLACAAWSCGASESSSSSAQLPVTPAQDSPLYALGHRMVQQFRMQGMFNEQEAAIIALGFTDAISGIE